MKLKRCLWIVINKNDDDIHIERIRYNKDHAEDLLRKADMVLMSATPPRRPFIRTFFECKFCSARGVCWDGVPVEKNCRTCVHSGIEHEAKWSCQHNDGAEIPVDFQRKGCDEYEAIEGD